MKTRYGVGLVLFALGCGGTSTKSGTIGPTGGVVALPDGTQVSIVAGALSSAVDITVSVDDSAPTPSDVVAVGHAYRFGPEGQQFLMPVEVTLAVDTAKLPTNKTLADVVIYTAPVGSSSYMALTTTVASSSAQAATTRFSIFVPGVANEVTAGMDQSAVTDMLSDASRSGVDLKHADSSEPADLASTPDLSNCHYTMTGGGGSCTLTESCDGHAYKLDCSNETCNCTTDGAVTKGPFGGTTCPASWTTCGYPGT